MQQIRITCMSRVRSHGRTMMGCALRLTAIVTLRRHDSFATSSEGEVGFVMGDWECEQLNSCLLSVPLVRLRA